MRSFCLFTAFCLIGCQTVAATTISDAAKLLPKAENPTSGIKTNEQPFLFHGLKSSAWISEKFNGSHARRIDGDILHFAGIQTAREGGLDIGLADPDIGKRRVANMSPDLNFCSSYDIDLTGVGRWWAGPKISVNWQGVESAKGNGDDWYENYIVEIANSTPEELHAIYTGDYFKAEVLPDTVIAGSIYKHYKIRFHDWWQFWSVRQDYRESGTVPAQDILDVWTAHGLPTQRLFDGIKANIETYGPIEGTGRFRIDVSDDPDSELDCTF